VRNALFEALSESVYSEVAALISSNENRPHFLIQLFRDLQMISSDPLRQRTLQSIQEVVSQYLANTVVDSHDQPPTDSQQLGEVSNNCHLLPVSVLLVFRRNQKMDGSSVRCSILLCNIDNIYYISVNIILFPAGRVRCVGQLVLANFTCWK
jgi:hypothetical protein